MVLLLLIVHVFHGL